MKSNSAFEENTLKQDRSELQSGTNALWVAAMMKFS